MQIFLSGLLLCINNYTSPVNAYLTQWEIIKHNYLDNGKCRNTSELINRVQRLDIISTCIMNEYVRDRSNPIKRSLKTTCCATESKNDHACAWQRRDVGPDTTSQKHNKDDQQTTFTSGHSNHRHTIMFGTLETTIIDSGVRSTAWPLSTAPVSKIRLHNMPVNFQQPHCYLKDKFIPIWLKLEVYLSPIHRSNFHKTRAWQNESYRLTILANGKFLIGIDSPKQLVTNFPVGSVIHYAFIDAATHFQRTSDQAPAGRLPCVGESAFSQWACFHILRSWWLVVKFFIFNEILNFEANTNL